MQQQNLLPGFCLQAGQSMWVMTHMGMVQLAEAPVQGLQVKLMQSSRAPPPALAPPPAGGRPTTSPRQKPIAPRTSAPPTSLNLPVQSLAQPLPAPPTSTSTSSPPTFIVHPNAGSYRLARRTPPPPSPKLFLPYKGTVRADPAAPPPLRREALKFDPSLMFLESPPAVCDWLSGRGGVQVLGVGVALPYLPPFVSSLSTLSALLRAKTALTKSALQLLRQGSEPQRPQTRRLPDGGAMATPDRPTDLPDSTSDCRPGTDQVQTRGTTPICLSRCLLRCVCCFSPQLRPSAPTSCRRTPRRRSSWQPCVSWWQNVSQVTRRISC